jgi:thiamine pyrophosphate-dependent acetolactate synthase large subunit-like protein
MFPGLHAVDCSSADELERALAECRDIAGPCFVSLALPEVEVPPFAAFRNASGEVVASVERGVRS